MNSVDEQAKILGTREFTVESWAAASQLERARMTASFLHQYDATDLDRSGIIKLLGRPTAYYNYDSNAAYIVGPTTVSSKYGDGYLLVFETDKDNGNVDRVFFVPDVE